MFSYRKEKNVISEKYERMMFVKLYNTITISISVDYNLYLKNFYCKNGKQAIKKT